MRKIGKRARWDYRHPVGSYKMGRTLPSGNTIGGVHLLIKNLTIRCLDLFGKNGTEKHSRQIKLKGHAEQINNLLKCLYEIDKNDYGSAEARLAQQLIKSATNTDLDQFEPIIINFNFKKAALRFSKKEGQNVSLQWWAYSGDKRF